MEIWIVLMIVYVCLGIPHAHRLYYGPIPSSRAPASWRVSEAEKFLLFLLVIAIWPTTLIGRR